MSIVGLVCLLQLWLISSSSWQKKKSITHVSLSYMPLLCTTFCYNSTLVVFMTEKKILEGIYFGSRVCVNDYPRVLLHCIKTCVGPVEWVRVKKACVHFLRCFDIQFIATIYCVGVYLTLLRRGGGGCSWLKIISRLESSTLAAHLKDSCTRTWHCIKHR